MTIVPPSIDHLEFQLCHCTLYLIHISPDLASLSLIYSPLSTDGIDLLLSDLIDSTRQSTNGVKLRRDVNATSAACHQPIVTIDFTLYFPYRIADMLILELIGPG